MSKKSEITKQGAPSHTKGAPQQFVNRAHKRWNKKRWRMGLAV